MQKYRNRMLIGVLIAFAIYIGILLVFDNQGQLTEGVVEALQAFPIWVLLPLGLTQVAVAVSRFLVWQFYLGVIGARHEISLFDSAVLFVSGFVLVMSPGKAAELLKAVLLWLKTDVPIARSAPIVIAERVVDGISVVVLLTLSLLLLDEQLALGTYRDASRAIVFFTAALLMFGMIAVQIAPLAYFVLNLLKRLPLIRRLYMPLYDFYESSREIFKLQNVIPATVRGVGVYVFSSVGFVLILWGFGLEITPTVILQAVFINGVTAAIGALSFVPNGAGITELSTLAMLQAIMMPSSPTMTLGMAAAIALLQGFFHKWFRVLLGMLVAFIFRNHLFPQNFDAALQVAEQEHKSHESHPLPEYAIEVKQA